jgi:thiol-disulfide isomerase/thioredoxin
VRKTAIIMLAVGIMAGTAGYFVAMVLSPEMGQQALQPVMNGSETVIANDTEDLLGRIRPDYTLSDINGVQVSSADFDGRALLINFWATWCVPCVEEMPMLSNLHQRYAERDFQVVGIALDDPEKASQFARLLGISYPVLVGTTDAILVGRQYGNRAGMLPYSVLIDRQGRVQWTYLGALHKEDLEKRILTLL